MPRLVIKEGAGVGRDRVLGAAPCVVGRDAAADFVLDDTLVSRRHFQVLRSGPVYVVEDLGSTNGTLLNGKRTRRGTLSDGDLIEVGGTRVTFVQKDLLGGNPAPSKGAARSIAAPVPRRRRR